MQPVKCDRMMNDVGHRNQQQCIWRSRSSGEHLISSHHEASSHGLVPKMHEAMIAMDEACCETTPWMEQLLNIHSILAGCTKSKVRSGKLKDDR